MVEMARRSGAFLGLTLRLAIPTQSRRVIGISKVVIILGNKVPNIRLVGPNQLHHIRHVDFMVDYIGAIMMKDEISALDMVRQGT